MYEALPNLVSEADPLLPGMYPDSPRGQYWEAIITHIVFTYFEPFYQRNFSGKFTDAYLPVLYVDGVHHNLSWVNPLLSWAVSIQIPPSYSPVHMLILDANKD